MKRTFPDGSTIYYVYDGEKPILEYKSDGSIAGKNVYGKGIDEILMRTDYVDNPGGLTYYYQEDHEGSVTQLTDATGHVIESYRYDAFGAPTTTHSEGTYNNRFMFTGREYVQQFGIYEYRARTYHPGLGRFMSEDPKGFDAGDYNLFRYCHNDPIDHTDPMGTGGARALVHAPPASDRAWEGNVQADRPTEGVRACSRMARRCDCYRFGEVRHEPVIGSVEQPNQGGGKLDANSKSSFEIIRTRPVGRRDCDRLQKP